ADSVIRLKQDGYDFVKVYAWSHPLYDSVIAVSRRVGLRVTGHVRQWGGQGDVSLEEALRDHWASVEHLIGYFGYLAGWFPDVPPFINVTGYPRLAAVLDTARWMQPQFRWDASKLRAIARTTREAGVWNCPTLATYSHMYADDSPQGALFMTT